MGDSRNTRGDSTSQVGVLTAIRTPVLSLVSVADEASKMSRSLEELGQVLAPVADIPQRELELTASWLAVIQQRWTELKRQHGINQYDVAAWIGVSQSLMPPFLGQSSRGAPATSPIIERLSLALGVPVPIIVHVREQLRELMVLPAPDDIMSSIEVLAAHAIDEAKRKK